MDGLHMIKSRNSFFLVRVERDFAEGEYIVKVIPVSPSDGGHVVSDDSCLVIEISHAFSEYSAMIDYLGFHEECSLVTPMVKGEGTRDMIKSTLSLCKKLFGISKITLHDASSFSCPGGGEVDLAVHNLLVYGRSWYERKFDAVPSPGMDISGWQHSRDLLKGRVDVGRATIINNFIETYYEEVEKGRYLGLVYDALSTGTTWNKLFENINISPGGCVFFTGRMMDLLAEIFEIPMIDSWYIPITDDDVSEYLVAHEKIDS